MISDVVQFVVFLLVLVPGVAAEEMLPKVLGVGFPVLLMSVQFVSLRLPLPPSVLFAVAAGAAEDAVCAAFCCSVRSFCSRASSISSCLRNISFILSMSFAMLSSCGHKGNCVHSFCSVG